MEGREIEELFGVSTIDVWDPGNGLIYIMGKGVKRDGEPTYLRINLQNRHIDSSISYYDDNPESVTYAERIKNISPERWQHFITCVIEEAENYTPKDDSGETRVEEA